MPEERAVPLVRVDRIRVVVRTFLMVSVGSILGLIAVFAVALLLLSAQKIEKNIVLIPPVLDGKINSFIFASLKMDGRGSSSLTLVPIASELKLTPTNQVLTENQESNRLQRAQVSVQIGVLVDEVWSVGQLPTALTKDTFLKVWQQQHDTTFNREWWQVRWLLAERVVETKADQQLADLAKLNQVARISPAARKCSVAIVNTTEVAGLASAISDYLEKIGLVVIRVTDNQSNSTQSHLVVADNSVEVCQEAIAVLGYISPEPLEVIKSQESADSYRAALVLLVGKNMIQVQEPGK